MAQANIHRLQLENGSRENSLPHIVIDSEASEPKLHKHANAIGILTTGLRLSLSQRRIHF